MAVPSPDGMILIAKPFSDADVALTVLEADAKKKKFYPLSRQMRDVKQQLNGVARALEKALAAAEEDPTWLPKVEAALAHYYGPEGLLYRYHLLHARNHYQKLLPQGIGDKPQSSSLRYDDLNSLRVHAPPSRLQQLTGEWMGQIDPNQLADGVLTYNGVALVGMDQRAITNWTEDERHLWNIGIELAHTQMNNWVSMDLLTPEGGGKLPCMSRLLRRRYMSLEDTDDTVEFLRWVSSESAYRMQLSEAVAPVLAKSPPLTTRALIEKLRETVTVPRLHEPQASLAGKLTHDQYTDVLVGVIGSAENQLAPIRFKQLLTESGAPLSKMSPEARTKRVAALATQARTWAIMQAVNQLIQEHNTDDTTPHANKNSEDWQKRRLRALIDAGFLNDYADQMYGLLAAAELPAPTPLKSGDGLDAYAQAVTTASRAAGQFAEEIRLTAGGLPTPRDIKVTPGLAWAIRNKSPNNDTSKPGYFTRVYKLNEMYTTDNGDSVLESINNIFNQGPRPFAMVKAEWESLVARTGHREQKELAKIGIALGLDGSEDPSLYRVFPSRAQRAEALQAYLRASIDQLPIISQPLPYHNDRPLYQVVHDLYQEKKNLYVVRSDDHMSIRGASVDWFVPRRDRSAARTQAQAVIDAIQDPIFDDIGKERARVAAYTDELVLDPRDPLARTLLNALRAKDGGVLFKRWGSTLYVDDGNSWYTDVSGDVSKRLDVIARDTLRAQPMYVLPERKLESPRVALDVREAGTHVPRVIITRDGSTQIERDDPWAGVLLRATAGTDRLKVGKDFVTIAPNDSLGPRLRNMRYNLHFRDSDRAVPQLVQDAVRQADPVFTVRDDGQLVFSKAAILRAFSDRPMFRSQDLTRVAPWATESTIADPRDNWINAREANKGWQLYYAGAKDKGIEVLNAENERMGFPLVTVELLDKQVSSPAVRPYFQPQIIQPQLFGLYDRGQNPRFFPFQSWRDPLNRVLMPQWWIPQGPRGPVIEGVHGRREWRDMPSDLVKHLDEYRRQRALFDSAARKYMSDYADSQDYSHYHEGGWVIRQGARDEMRPNPGDGEDALEDAVIKICGDETECALDNYWHDVNGYRQDPTYMFAKNPERRLLEMLSGTYNMGVNKWEPNDRSYRRFRERFGNTISGWTEEVTEGTKGLDEGIEYLEELSRDRRIGDWLLSSGDPNYQRRRVADFARTKKREVRDLRAELQKKQRLLVSVYAALPSPSQLAEYKRPTEGIRDSLDTEHARQRGIVIVDLMKRGVLPSVVERVYQRAINEGDNLLTFTKEDVGDETLARELNHEQIRITPSFGDVGRLAGYHARKREAQTLKSTVAGPKMRMNEALEALNKDAEAFLPMHGEVQGVVSKYLVLDSLRESLKSVCDNLTEVGEMERDDMEKLLLAEGARAAILARFPHFKGIDQRMYQEFFDYQTGLQKATHILTAVVVIGLFISFFIPGVNLLTGAAAPFVAVLLPSLFAAEAAWTVRDMGILKDRIRFSKSMGKTTSLEGRMLANEGVTAALEDELSGKYWDLALDLLFVALEGARAVRVFKQIARGFVMPIPEATKSLQKMGVQVTETSTISEAEAAFTAWTREAKVAPEFFTEASAEAKAAMKQFTAAKAALENWKVSKAQQILQSHGFQMPRNPTEEQIQKAFRDWVTRSRSHPDMHAGNALRSLEAEQRFKDVTKAVEIWKAHIERMKKAPGMRGVDTHAPITPLPALPAPR